MSNAADRTAASEAAARAAMLDDILQHIPYGICVFGRDRRVVALNDAYSHILRDLPIAVGDRFEDLVRRRAETGAYGPGPVDALVAERLAHDRSRPQLRRRRHPDGSAIEIRNAPLPGGGHVSVVADVTPLAEAEEALSRRIAVMDGMLAHIRHGVILWDREHRVVACNRIAAEVLGHPPGLLVPGRSQQEILASMVERGEFGAGDPAQAHARRILERDRSVSGMTQRTTPSGRTLEVRSDPTPEGGFITTYTDVTEARAVERELQRAKAEAQAANQAKSRFLATMSHELRTPLNVVIGFSEALGLEASGRPEPGRVGEFAGAINAAGRELLTLIDTILDVARIEAGRFDMSAERVDVLHLIHACVGQSRAAAAAAEVLLTVEAPDNLPQVMGDERRLRQALNHLLSNAVKFTPAGGTVRVIAAVTGDGELLISVVDTGIGIPAAELDRVFEPFTQLDTSLARRFQGSGLGLYMCRALVSAHDGQLALSSRVGEGTTAKLWLPAHRLVHPRSAVMSPEKPRRKEPR